MRELERSCCILISLRQETLNQAYLSFRQVLSPLDRALDYQCTAVDVEGLDRLADTAANIYQYTHVEDELQYK